MKKKKTADMKTGKIRFKDGTIKSIRLSDVNDKLQNYYDAETKKPLVKIDLIGEKGFCALKILRAALKFSNEFSHEIIKQAELIIAIMMAEALKGIVVYTLDSDECIVCRHLNEEPSVIFVAKLADGFIGDRNNEEFGIVGVESIEFDD